MPQIDIAIPASYDVYLASLSRGQRRNLKRESAGLMAQGAIRDVVVVSQDEAVAEFDALVRVHEQRWARAGKLGHFADWPHAEEFNRDLVREEAERGRARIYVLYVGEQPVSWHFAFRFADRIHVRVSARETGEPWEKCGLGRVALAHIIRCATEEGIRSFDAGMGKYSYKLRLGGVESMPVSLRFVRTGPIRSPRVKALSLWSWAMNLAYYRVWFQRVRPKLGLRARGLSPYWIRTHIQ